MVIIIASLFNNAIKLYVTYLYIWTEPKALIYIKKQILYS